MCKQNIFNIYNFDKIAIGRFVYKKIPRLYFILKNDIYRDNFVLLKKNSNLLLSTSSSSSMMAALPSSPSSSVSESCRSFWKKFSASDLKNRSSSLPDAGSLRIESNGETVSDFFEEDSRRGVPKYLNCFLGDPLSEKAKRTSSNSYEKLS